MLRIRITVMIGSKNVQPNVPTITLVALCLSTTRTPNDGDQPDSFCRIIEKFCATVPLALGYAF